MFQKYCAANCHNDTRHVTRGIIIRTSRTMIKDNEMMRTTQTPGDQRKDDLSVSMSAPFVTCDKHVMFYSRVIQRRVFMSVYLMSSQHLKRLAVWNILSSLSIHVG